MSKKVVLTGATGMVGGHLLAICLASEQISEVRESAKNNLPTLTCSFSF